MIKYMYDIHAYIIQGLIIHYLVILVIHVQTQYTPYNFCFYTVLFALVLYLHGQGLKNLTSDTDSQIMMELYEGRVGFLLHNWFSAIP